MKSTARPFLILLLFVGLLGAIPVATNTGDAPHTSFVVADGEAWLDGWTNRKEITLTTAGGVPTDYQIFLNVTYDSDMESDFADIRFTDDDGETLLDYWREDYTNDTYAIFWVEVADDLSGGGNVYMYYNNDAVSTTSNGDNTFEFFEDWTSETIGAQWTVENSDGGVSYSAGDANHGTVIKVQGNAGTNVYSFYSDDSFTSSYALRMRSYTEKTAASAQSTKQGWNDVGAGGYAMIESYQGAARIVIRNDASATDHQNIADSNYGAWHVFDSLRDGTNTQWVTDGVEVAEGDNSPDSLGYHVYVYCRDSEYDTYNDWFVVRKYLVNEPSVSFGSEEPPEEWAEIAENSIVVSMSYDMWGYNTGLIILGLIMIPASTIYLAYGAKHDRSSDRLFYGLIILIMGFGLFIGGIIP